MAAFKKTYLQLVLWSFVCILLGIPLPPNLDSIPQSLDFLAEVDWVGSHLPHWSIVDHIPWVRQQKQVIEENCHLKILQLQGLNKAQGFRLSTVADETEPPLAHFLLSSS